jgi:hypothetical protein
MANDNSDTRVNSANKTILAAAAGLALLFAPSSDGSAGPQAPANEGHKYYEVISSGAAAAGCGDVVYQSGCSPCEIHNPFATPVDWSEDVIPQIQNITRTWECDYLQKLNELVVEVGLLPIEASQDAMRYEGTAKDIRARAVLELTNWISIIGGFRSLGSEGFWTDMNQNGKTVGRDEQALSFGGLGFRVPLYLNGEASEACEDGFSHVFVQGGGLISKIGGQFQYSCFPPQYHEKQGTGFFLGLGLEAKTGPNSVAKGLVDYNQLWLDYVDGKDDEIREVAGVEMEFLVENWLNLFGKVNMETSKTKDERATQWEPKQVEFTYDAGLMLRLGAFGVGMYARGLETDSPVLMAMGKLFFGAGSSAYVMTNLQDAFNVGVNFQFGDLGGDSE